MKDFGTNLVSDSKSRKLKIVIYKETNWISWRSIYGDRYMLLNIGIGLIEDSI